MEKFIFGFHLYLWCGIIIKRRRGVFFRAGRIMRVFLIVIDSFGIGEMPDAEQYGDAGSNTYGHVYEQTGVRLTNLVALGLNNIQGVNGRRLANGSVLCGVEKPKGAFARLSEKTAAKDTTAGHYEIAGLIMDKPYRIYKKFPADVVADLEKETGFRFLGNEAASGTEIIQRLGEEHLRTGKPILYTSQDSVMQIAADTSVVPLEKLYEICEKARALMVGERAVGRIIARPFIHRGGKFTRTEDRKDYALEPPGKTLLDRLFEKGVKVTSVGKIKDIFCGRGIAESIHTGNNAEGISAVKKLVAEAGEGFVFVNLVDTDMLYGHRNDVQGYAAALKYFDDALPEIMRGLHGDDLLIVTADHGCDPSTPSTDHSREYVPLLIYGEKVRPIDLGTISGFDCIANFVSAAFLGGKDEAIYDKIMEGNV